jgi:hypothetical protein
MPGRLIPAARADRARRELPMRAISSLTCGLSALLALGACASDDAAQNKSTPGSSEDAPEAITSVDGLERRAYDLNRDDKPDVYKFYKVTGDDEILVRKEYDLNLDSKIDVWRFYSDKGEMIREDMDYDFDGHIDAENYYETGVLLKQAMDLSFDGKPDLFKFFDKGTIARLEADTNNDGKTDYWEYYEKGSLDRIGIDRDGDGTVDDWKRGSGDEASS